MYKLWELAVLNGSTKLDFPEWERKAIRRNKELNVLIHDINVRAELNTLVRKGLISQAEAKEYYTPVRFAGIDVLK